MVNGNEIVELLGEVADCDNRDGAEAVSAGYCCFLYVTVAKTLKKTANEVSISKSKRSSESNVPLR